MTPMRSRTQSWRLYLTKKRTFRQSADKQVPELISRTHSLRVDNGHCRDVLGQLVLGDVVKRLLLGDVL